MSIKVLVNGALGKMGALACKTIQQHPDFELVAGLTREDNLREQIAETRAQIVIDLTRADSAYPNTLAIIESGAHPVIGTSGLMDEEIKFLQGLCNERRLGGIIVPNFSISAVLMMHFSATAARFLPQVEIIEAHHPQKFDAPSGTAVKTAEMIAAARTALENEQPTRELITGVRGGRCQNIPIHSLRLPGILARQEVLFGNTGETLSITHNSIDRASFMPGILLCCQNVMRLQSLHYGLEHLLDLNLGMF